MDEKTVAAKTTRILKISYSDPQATDSSSDDEFVPHRGPKKITHSIPFQFTPSPPLPPIDDAGPNNLKLLHVGISCAPIPNRFPPSNGRPKLAGVRMRASGKFSAEIKHPITKKRLWLGSFVTQAEAAAVLISKRREFDALKAKKKTTKKKEKRVSIYSLPNWSTENSPVSGVDNGTPPPSETLGEAGHEEEEEDDDDESRFGFWNGVQVIDKNGFFLGEFSRIDDLMLNFDKNGGFLS